MICDYWMSYVQTISDLSPAYQDLVHPQKPTIEHQNLHLIARNEAEANALKKRLESGFQQFCKKIGAPVLDRKSTRLNSSHVAISYAVFCLKKKKKKR